MISLGASLEDLSQPRLIQFVDAVCDRFEAAWKTGSPPCLEQYVGATQHCVRSALLRELLALDVAYRLRAGEPVRAEEYCARFPQEAELIHALFSEAIAPSAPHSVNGALSIREAGSTSAHQAKAFPSSSQSNLPETKDCIAQEPIRITPSAYR